MARQEDQDGGITINAEPKYAYYSRYVNFEKTDGTREIWHLHCPFCQAEEISIIEEIPEQNKHMIGDKARCWVCKRVFTVTENCWKLQYQTP